MNNRKFTIVSTFFLCCFAIGKSNNKHQFDPGRAPTSKNESVLYSCPIGMVFSTKDEVAICSYRDFSLPENIKVTASCSIEKGVLGFSWPGQLPKGYTCPPYAAYKVENNHSHCYWHKLFPPKGAQNYCDYIESHKFIGFSWPLK